MSTALLVFAVAISPCFQVSTCILTSMTPSPEITESSFEKTLFSLAPDVLLQLVRVAFSTDRAAYANV